MELVLGGAGSLRSAKPPRGFESLMRLRGRRALEAIRAQRAGWMIPKRLRQVRHPVPYLRIDDQGIECARGRFFVA